MSMKDVPVYSLTNKTRFHFDYLPMRETPDELGRFLLYQVGDLCAEAGFRIYQHVQYCHEITYIESGSGQFCVNGKWFPVTKGDIILTRKGDLHDGIADAANPLRQFYLGFDIAKGDETTSDGLRDVMQLFENRTEVLARSRPEIAPFFMGIFQELVNRSNYVGEMIETYVMQLLITIGRAFYGDSTVNYNPARAEDLNGHLAHEITTYIDANFERLERLSTIARALGYSYSHLAHVFKEKMDMSIYEYYDKKRFDRAVELLQYGDLSVTEIAERLRYQSLHSFSKAFSKRYGISPTEYATMYRNRVNYQFIAEEKEDGQS